MMRLNFNFIILLACLLAACNASTSNEQANVTYVVITDAPSLVADQGQQVTAIPTPIPPTPIPDVEPEVALQIADRYLQDGYYENAVFAYQALLERADVPDTIKASAAYGVGQAALKEGLFQNAATAMTVLIEQYPNDFRAVQAYFLRGDAHLGLSNWQAAIDDFQQYLTLRPGLIDSYVHERIADAQLALNQFDAALASYDLATDANRSLVPQLALREKVARLYTLNGQVENTIQEYDAILAVAQNDPYRAQIEFRAGEALLEAGDTQSGLARMRRVFLNYEATPQAYEAMNILNENGMPMDTYLQGRVSYYFGDYEGAVENFNTYTTQVTLDQIPAELQLLLGLSYRQLGNSQAALVAFQTIIEQYPNDPLFGDALLETGRTRFLDNEIDAAIARYTEIADTYGYLNETAAEALWRAGYLHGTNDRLAESRAIFERIVDTYPDTEWATSGLVIAASAAESAGDLVGAETLYSRLAATTTGEEQASAYLQLGRLALRNGNTAQAEQAFTQASTAAPDTYFSARASDLANGIAPFTPPSQYVFAFDEVAEVTAAENWIRERFGVVQDSPLWPLSPALEAEPRVVRGRELWAVGAVEDAEIEFSDLLQDYSQDGLASYQLAVFLRILGVYDLSQVGAANLIRLAGIGTLDAPSFIARLRYPVPYRDEVLRVANEREIDPLLLFSLMRHESLFDTNATGAAGEIGMTQVIPSTGEYIAGQLNWPDYQHRDLFRPYAAIEFGAYYLEEQLNRFAGNVYAALAGYNAGPGRAQAWLDLSGGDPDIFMSTITIDTVQLYIQSIYRNYSIYRTLYGI